MNQFSPMRQSMKVDAQRGENPMPASNYFGGTFYKTASTASPIKMMQTATNEQKMRVIQSNRRDAWGSIDANTSRTVRNESAQLGLVS